MKIIGINEIGDYIAKNRYKNKWYVVSINEGEIQMKCFNLWIQIFKYEDKNYGLSSEFKRVSDFKEYINNTLQNYNKSHIVAIEIL